ncbi:MAG: putative Ig domain-containing protein [Myxococcota bacterium]|jgi:hypothetical protein|nr:putative Ig domain-containing protein [Myxococcota bacterium]
MGSSYFSTGTTRRIVAAVASAALASMLIACGGGEEAQTTGLKMGEAPTPAETTTSAASNGMNSPPEISDLVLRPENPRPGERLTAVVEAFDPDGDAIRLHYEWTVDGAAVENRSNEFMLKDVAKGAYVEVSVTARDQEDGGESMEVGAMIGNRPPVLKGVVFEPLGEVSVSYDVTAAPRSYDPDGDEVEYIYSWRVNGSEVSTEALLSADEFARGDKIVLEVIADDGEDESKPLVSQPVTVVNASPKIVSSPLGFGGERFSYTLEVEDPDGDRSFRYHLVQGPDGMSVDSLNGIVSWVPRNGQEGNHLVEVTVEDQKGGEDRQRFELTLGLEEAAPANSAD